MFILVFFLSLWLLFKYLFLCLWFLSVGVIYIAVTVVLYLARNKIIEDPVLKVFKNSI
jgi:hypothetical protein